MADNTHETKIVVSGNATGAVGALGSVKAALGAVSRGISVASSALAKFNWAVAGIQMLIEGFRKLKEAINAAAKRAEELFRVTSIDNAARAIDRMTNAQEKYNASLKKSLDLLARRNAATDQETSAEIEIADEERKYERARQMATAMTPERQAELRQQWRVQDERTARERRSNQLMEASGRKNDEAKSYEEAAAAADEAATRIGIAMKQLLADMESGGATPEQQKQLAEMKAKKAAAEAEAENARNFAKAAREAAARMDDLRSRLEAIGSAASEENAGEDARKEHDEAEKARELEAEHRREEAEKINEEDRKKAEEDRKKAEEEIRKQEKNADELGAFSERLAATEGPTENRLTAMGLGSGVDARSPVASDVKKIVDLLKQQLEEEKKQNSDGPSVATYGA